MYRPQWTSTPHASASPSTRRCHRPSPTSAGATCGCSCPAPPAPPAAPCPTAGSPNPVAGTGSTSSCADIADEVARLRAAGIPFRNDVVTGPGGQQIVLEDPSGNPVELFQPAERHDARRAAGNPLPSRRSREGNGSPGKGSGQGQHGQAVDRMQSEHESAGIRAGVVDRVGEHPDQSLCDRVLEAGASERVRTSASAGPSTCSCGRRRSRPRGQPPVAVGRAGA